MQKSRSGAAIFETAEAEAYQACERVRPFPAVSWEIFALRVQILLALGRTAEALGIAEETLQRLESLGLFGLGEIKLRLALAEARFAAGHSETAREMLRMTLTKLRLRVDDIPDAAMRSCYLTQVPLQARVLALAREWLGDEAVRAAGLEPKEQHGAT